ncbi:MAG: sugar ABC transporter permease [Eubacteriales bacterium]|nr:sugar ABC transporter permease [Eubacteriales bacterium]
MRNKKKTVQYMFNEIIFLGPMFAAFLMVKFIPLIMSAVYSFSDWNGISSGMSFNGLVNYRKLLADSQYWYSMGFTMKFAIVSVILANLLGFVLANILTMQVPGRNILRAVFYIPNTLGGLVLGFIWRFIFLYAFGYLAEAVGLSFMKIAWFNTSISSFWAMVIVQVWVLSGYLMLLYIAGIVQIPGDMVEAARIDGAGLAAVMTKVKIPFLMTTFTRCIFLSFLTCMRVYDINLALTAGNPFRSSESVTMNIYGTAFTGSEMAYGCSKALIFIVIVVVLSSLQVYLTSKSEVEA